MELEILFCIESHLTKDSWRNIFKDPEVNIMEKSLEENLTFDSADDDNHKVDFSDETITLTDLLKKYSYNFMYIIDYIFFVQISARRNLKTQNKVFSGEFLENFQKIR